ncbi:hypothetical protein U3A58_21650, partial [Algoriphagus sp. C2-6-M1]|uniref:hypothetical protein n=1 Tax=Algoriphagus persicinus TaxID=3108754 RepID=UPI002B38A2E3
GAVSSLDKFHIKRYKNHPISPIGIVGIFSEILNEFLDSLTVSGLAKVAIFTTNVDAENQTLINH